MRVKTFVQQGKKRAEVVFDRASGTDICCIELLSASGREPISWCSHGYISDGKSCLLKGCRTTIQTSGAELQYECIVSQYRGDELIGQENTVVEFVQQSDDTAQNTLQVASGAGSGLHDKLEAIITERASKLRVEVKGDIIVTSERLKERTIFAFGTSSNEISASDFTFWVDRQGSKIVIPKEIFWKKHPHASQDSMFGCFELVKVAFHNVKNVYYKVLASNRLRYSDFPRQSRPNLSSFKDPLGRAFNRDWSISTESSLPVFVGKK